MLILPIQPIRPGERVGKHWGLWKIQQLAWLRYGVVGDKGFEADTLETHGDSPETEPDTSIGNTFKWSDGPGANKVSKNGNLISYDGRYNFIIKAFHGKTQCVVSFSAHVTYSNGKPAATWSDKLF